MEYGVHFSDHKLFLYVGESMHVIEAWPDLRHWIKTPKKDWILSKGSPYPDLLHKSFGFFASLERGDSLPESEVAILPILPTKNQNGFFESHFNREVLSCNWYPQNRKKVFSEFNSYWKTFPTKVCELFQSWNPNNSILWNALQNSSKIPGFLDLVESNPALAFAISDKSQRKTNSKENIYKIIRYKQKEIAHIVGFSSDSVQTLKKLEPKSFSKRNMNLIQNFWENEHLKKILLHSPKINTELLSFLLFASTRGYTKKISPSFAHNVSTIGKLYDRLEFEFLDEYTKDDFRMGEILFYAWRDVVDFYPNRKIESIGQLEKIHNEMIQEIETQKDISVLNNNTQFPDPPFREVSILLDPEGEPFRFFPIRSSYELFQESKKFRNCVFSFEKKILSGSYYFYKLEGVENCHISLRKSGKNKKNIWYVEECKSAFNKLPSYKSMKAILEWAKILGIKISLD
jgi:hypothetical protein